MITGFNPASRIFATAFTSLIPSTNGTVFGFVAASWSWILV